MPARVILYESSRRSIPGRAGPAWPDSVDARAVHAWSPPCQIKSGLALLGLYSVLLLLLVLVLLSAVCTVLCASKST